MITNTGKAHSFYFIDNFALIRCEITHDDKL